MNNDIQYGSNYIAKRLLDFFCLIFFSIIYIPLAALTFIYIVLKDGNPPLIKQTRVGLHGKNFGMYKFRTMKKDSHTERDELEDLNTHNGPLFKLKMIQEYLKAVLF